jgi:hypothetical protein
VNKADSNSKNDSDVLRAKDMVPPYNGEIRSNEAAKGTQSHTSQQVTNKPAHDITVNATDSKMTSDDFNHVEHTVSQRDDGQVPRFDLAEDIMAEQRKITGLRRKGPRKRFEGAGIQEPVTSFGQSVFQPIQSEFEQQQIVSEIVARDIEKLFRTGRY